MLFYESRKVLTVLLALCLLCAACPGALADGIGFEPERSAAVQGVYWQLERIAVDAPQASAHKAFDASSLAEGVELTAEGEALPGFAMEERVADGASLTLEITRKVTEARTAHAYRWSGLPVYVKGDEVHLSLSSEVLAGEDPRVDTYLEVNLAGERIGRIAADSKSGATPTTRDLTFTLPARARDGAILRLSFTARDMNGAIRAQVIYYFTAHTGDAKPTPTPSP